MKPRYDTPGFPVIREGQAGKCCSSKKKKQRHSGKPPAHKPAQSSTTSTTSTPRLPQPKGRNVPPAPASKPDMTTMLPPQSMAKQPPPATKEEQDERIAMMDDILDDFMETDDYEEQVALFDSALNENLLDDEGAYDMLTTLYYPAVERGEQARFEAMLDRLQAQLPDAYNEYEHIYLDYRISNALATGQLKQLPNLVSRLSQKAGKYIDLFLSMIEALAYHGQTDCIADALQKAWPSIREQDEVLDIEEIAAYAVSYIIFFYLEHAEHPDAHDPKLVSLITMFRSLDPDRLSPIIQVLTGKYGVSATPEDFVFELPQSALSEEDEDDEDENDEDDEDDEDEEDDIEDGDLLENLVPLSVQEQLAALSFEFLAYLHIHEQVPYTRAELARSHLEQYFLLRMSDQLKRPKADFFSQMLFPQQRRRARHKKKEPICPLCPDCQTLSFFIDGMTSFLEPQEYKIVALLEHLPSWLRFLEKRQWIDAQQHASLREELRVVVEESRDIWDEYYTDPLLKKNMQRAWGLDD